MESMRTEPLQRRQDIDSRATEEAILSRKNLYDPERNSSVFHVKRRRFPLSTQASEFLSPLGNATH